MATNATNIFDTPTPAGYSTHFLARQSTPFLNSPGPQGQTEGVGGGQQHGLSDTGAIWGGGAQPGAPPSSVPQNANFGSFGGSGEGTSSLAPPQWNPQAQAHADALMQTLQAPSSFSAGAPPQPGARQAWANLMNR